MGTKVIIVQHAEKERAPGDPGLTPQGERQAFDTAQHLRSLTPSPARVYASPLLRAQETARPIASALGVPLVTDARLRERANWDGPGVQSLEEFLAEWDRASRDRDFVPCSGDSSKQAAARYRAFLDGLTEDGLHVAVAHGGVTTDLLRDLLGDAELLARAPEIIDHGVPCCGLTELERTVAGWSVIRIGDTSHFQAPARPEVPYRRDLDEYVYMTELGRNVLAPARYARGPDSERHPDVPVGQLIEHTWDQSQIYPGTTRRYWVYVPAQYRAEEGANLLVVQDGWYYLDLDNQIRTAVVLDNLIHQGEIPVTIGVFVDPGEFPSENDPVAKRNRNLEYDTYSDAYARFLLEEILPPVLRDYHIAEDPERWAITGGSSGGDCSFTVAWMRPDRFRKVLIFESSWPQVRGADYERPIIESPPKPLRVFMHAASRDIGWWRSENNWFSSNLRVAAALAERGYDLRFVLGDGPHDPNHAGVVLPDALRWLLGA